MWCNVGVAGCIKGDCINGQGTYDYLHGEEYVGEHKDGREHGQGTFTSPIGNKYVGGWKDGKQHGQGTFTTTDGRVYKGIWENNELVERQE